MDNIAFIDTEIDIISEKIVDIGAIKGNGASFHCSSVAKFIEFIGGTQFIGGHNILNHDIKYIGKALNYAGIDPTNIIDTLFLSPLLFPTQPYHSLLKDDKLQSDYTNNPLNDSIKAKDLFYDEVAAFKDSNNTLKEIYYLLLNDKKEFHPFFKYIGYSSKSIDIEKLIREKFENEICQEANFATLISDTPIELAYSLSLIDSFIHHKKSNSITPPWVLKNYPKVEQIMFRLRNKPCEKGCSYCNTYLDAHKGLKRFFGFDSYRSYGGEPLQERAVRAALNHKSMVVVFPTGGGKSITFQIPALMSGESSKGLTIVISPLQSLMKDQVDNLEKSGITEAVTINGLLDPIERAKSFERVREGSASILYISPESLRSRTIERLILGRKIARFVIDEAHCFSAWGQDFRVDYLYIGDFIKSIQEKKNLNSAIPVSCFTATAKQQVINDIREYFKEKLSLNLQLFTSGQSRINLQYKVLNERDDEEKYQTARDLVEEKRCPTIIYVSRTQKAYEIAKRLIKDGFRSKAYHGKMEKLEKSANQDSFMAGETQIMVATSAFGMGVDKKDVGLVIHYDISDSLENYIQEAGRAGRDEKIHADCVVLFNEEDLNKHFLLLNQTKLSIKEIQQVWKAIKEITPFRSTVSNSALEIARQAGWDDSVYDIETRVTTAIAALEDAGYLKRGQNMPRIFANSILTKNAQEAIDKIETSNRFRKNQKVNATRIIKKLFSSKSRKYSIDELGESRVDYISDHLGIIKREVIEIINILREEEILADAKDLTAFIKKGEKKNRSLNILNKFIKIEDFLLSLLKGEEQILHIKEINELAEENRIYNISSSNVKTIFNFWAIQKWIKRKRIESQNHIALLSLHPLELLKEKLERRKILAQSIVEFLYEKSNEERLVEQPENHEVLVEFSIQELKNNYEKSAGLYKIKITLDDIEEALFYLSRIGALKIEGGFLISYNSLTIERTELDNKKRYTKEDYKKLEHFYQSKVEQIHIVGEYANKMMKDAEEALQFVEDYFQKEYPSFLQQYFSNKRLKEIKQNITPSKFKKLFGELSPTQLKIISDNETQHIVVAAGPGSGKTRILVHKLASLLLMEDVKHEQLLMITFSRAAATEFKKHLLNLIGNAANYVEIKTFHSYCFDLLGKVGSLERSQEVIEKAVEKINSNEIEISRITKTVLVIDEAQDIDQPGFNLIRALMEKNEEMRVIAVGDDDQNIYEFRGASSKYLEHFITKNRAIKYELVQNFRSAPNLVDFSNQFAKCINHRLKQNPIIAHKSENGKLKIVRHQSENLIEPLVEEIVSTKLTGTTCVLTKTNSEAQQITGLLLKKRVPAKLIQSNDDFNLYNLDEVRYFLSHLNLTEDTFTIREPFWSKAKEEVSKKFQKSTKLEIIEAIIKEFEASNPRIKYKSDLELFIRESNLEDFYIENRNTIFVSTIHKAKGREFDNLFLMLENFKIATDQEKRLLYVAMTRAKENLTIHLNSDFLDNIAAHNLERVVNRENHLKPSQLVIHLSMRDVWLNYFITRQEFISHLISGDCLTVKEDDRLYHNERAILRFSKKFYAQFESIKADGYKLKSAKVNFIIYWKNTDTKQEIKVILPELIFERESY